MAASPGVHRCYARHWLEFLAGRAVAPGDAALLDRVGGASLAGELPVLEVLRALVESETFTTRAVEAR